MVAGRRLARSPSPRKQLFSLSFVNERPKSVLVFP
jgi:hypothetical protein